MIRLIAVLIVLTPALSNVDEQSEILLQAKRALFETISEESSEEMVKIARYLGSPDSEIDSLVTSSLKALSDCIITEVHAQALKQGLPVDIVLPAFAGGTVDNDVMDVLLQLDNEAINVRTERCDGMMMAGIEKASSAEQVTVGSSPGGIELADTGITFTPPEGFERLPKNLIDLKWPGKNAPRYVVANAGATTTVAFDVKNKDLSVMNMEDLRVSFEQMFNVAIPGIQWKQNKVVSHDGKKWILLEMTSSAIDTDIHNIMFITSFQKRMVIFNFNSTKQDFPLYEEVLRASMESIRFPSAD